MYTKKILSSECIETCESWKTQRLTRKFIEYSSLRILRILIIEKTQPIEVSLIHTHCNENQFIQHSSQISNTEQMIRIFSTISNDSTEWNSKEIQKMQHEKYIWNLEKFEQEFSFILYLIMFNVQVKYLHKRL